MGDVVEGRGEGVVLRCSDSDAALHRLLRDHPEADWQAGDRAGDMVAALKFKKPGVAAVYRAVADRVTLTADGYLGRLLGRRHPTRLQLAGIVLGLCGGAVLGAATG